MRRGRVCSGAEDNGMSVRRAWVLAVLATVGVVGAGLVALWVALTLAGRT